jgi:imidazolonepropionase-like amidohydrolase
VEVGKRADLLLVAGDPLANVANVGRRVGVMARGRWLTETELQSRLEALASVEATLAPPSA